MEIEFPPHIAVNRLLRRQRERKRAFRDWFDEVFERDWRDGRPKGPALRDFARAYEATLAEAGAFDLRTQGSPDRLLLKAAKGFEVEGKVLWPIGLGQDAQEVDSAYAEDALLISRVGASIASNKVRAHEAPLSLCLTKHALVRLIEREGVDGDLEQSLAAALPGFIEDAALALALGIAKVVDEGEEEWSRTAFVPLGSGIVVLTNRIVAADRHNQDLGWRFDYIKRKYTGGYVKPELLQPFSHVAAGYMGVGMWFATTFLSREQLTGPQARYADTFSSFAAGASRRLKDTAFAVQFDPDYVDRQQRSEAALAGIDEETYGLLRNAVEGQAFKAHKRDGFAFLIEADTSSKAFRSLLKGS